MNEQLTSLRKQLDNASDKLIRLSDKLEKLEAKMQDPESMTDDKKIKIHNTMMSFMVCYDSDYDVLREEFYTAFTIPRSEMWDNELKLVSEKAFISNRLLRELCFLNNISYNHSKKELLELCCTEHRYSNHRGYKINVDQLFSLFE